MQPRRLAAVVRLNLMLQLRDPGVTILMTLVPLVLIPFMMPAGKAMLTADGYLGASGAEQAVPGMAVLFSFLSVQTVIQLFFNEYGWGTWTRLRASAASDADIIAGKVLVAFAVQAAQLAAVLLLGTALFGYRPTGSAVALAAVVLVFAAVLTVLGVALSTWVRSEGTALSLANLIGMLAAGLGGALCPVSSFPSWAEPLARLSPAYWALDAARAVSLDGAGLSDVAPQLAALMGFALVFTVLVMVKCLRGIDAVKTE